MNLVKRAVLFLPLIFILSCSETEFQFPVIPNEQTQPEVIRLQYDFRNITPVYNQTLMMTEYGGKLFIYGWHGRIMIVRPETRGTGAWNYIEENNDTITWRWDGTMVTVNNEIYIFANPLVNVSSQQFPKYYNVLKLNPINNKVTPLPELLPFKFQDAYPVGTSYGDKAIILFRGLDSLYVFDTKTEKGKFVSENKLKDTREDAYDKIYSAGKYENYFYVYSSHHRKLFRIDLGNYEWREIEIPSLIKGKLVGTCGGMFNGVLCLFGQKNIGPICYDAKTNEWYFSEPEFDFNLFNETIFCEYNKELYFVDVFTRLIWKVGLN